MRELNAQPVTPDRVDDLARVFGPTGDAPKCWCAYWHRTAKDFKADWGSGNRDWFAEAVANGLRPGIVGYLEGDPVGWAAIAPRAVQDRLIRPRTALAPMDDAPVWSLNCVTVRKDHRRSGLMRPLIRAAIAHARGEGARIVEAYPVIGGANPRWDLFRGKAEIFADLGFTEALARTPRQPIWRLRLDEPVPNAVK